MDRRDEQDATEETLLKTKPSKEAKEAKVTNNEEAAAAIEPASASEAAPADVNAAEKDGPLQAKMTGCPLWRRLYRSTRNDTGPESAHGTPWMGLL